MATYYQWNQYETAENSEQASSFGGSTGSSELKDIQIYYANAKPTPDGGAYKFSSSITLSPGESYTFDGQVCIGGVSQETITCFVAENVTVYSEGTGVPQWGARSNEAGTRYTVSGAGEEVGNVYSISSNAYPNGGYDGPYYYDGRTTVTSPTAASGLTYPSLITTPSVTVSWTAASSNTNYPVNLYEVSYSTNGGTSWTVAGTTSGTSYSFSIPAGTTSIMFRVRARDSNSQYGAYTTGTAAQVILAPTLTVPEMVMQGQSATVSWSEVEGADSYTLERKSSADADWTQVYSGANLSYTETVGTWTSLQYRVCAVFEETSGGWATSGDIQIVAASALVISGSDGDLGTLTSDVSYSVSSDQTAPVIDVTVAVNGGEYASFQAASGQNYSIGVLDLPTGTGSIVITATTTVSESPVTVTRTWTYTKAAQSFPNAGSVARLTQEGDTIWPQTLAEAVRTTGGPWGGDLSKALNLLQRAAVYNRTSVPKYSEVSIDLSTATVGQEINLPVNGVMTPHIVVHIGNPNPELYDASCDGVWLLRKDIVENGQWNASNVNTLAGSTIMTTMQGYVDDYDETVQAAIKTVKIPYCVGNGSSTVNSGASGLECKIFPLGAREVGITTNEVSYSPNDGAKLSYFENGNSSKENQKRIANYASGAASTWWLRSPYTTSSISIIDIMSSGMNTASNAVADSGLRPAFLLPTTFTATYYVDTQGTVHPSQEYTAAGDFSDLWGNDIPTVKIETGSYTGTGTYGVSNPNTLTFSFEPSLVIVIVDSNHSSGSVNIQRGFFINGIDRVDTYVSGNTAYSVYLTWNGNTVSWYAQQSINAQLNVINSHYYYIALG